MKKKKEKGNNKGLSRYLVSALLFLLFEAVAITLWLIKDNLFYLLNFSYIGTCLALGTALFTAEKRYARHFVQLAVGSYMLLYLGIISRENMQIEGFWYYLFLGVFEAATIATVYKGNIIKNLIMDCQSYTKYRPNETTGGIFVSWRRKEELPTGA